MRLSSQIIAACAWRVATSVAASTPAARVYLLDQAPKEKAVSVTPETARSIFAQRLGLSHLYSLSSTDDEVIEHINAFGGRAQQLFGQDEPLEKALVVVEGVEDVAGVDTASFTIANAPHSEANEQLISSFWTQSQVVEQTNNSPSLVRLLRGLGSVEGCTPRIQSDNSITVLYTQCQKRRGVNEDFQREMKELSKHMKSGRYSVTVALMPPRSSSKILSTNPYSLPTLSKRQTSSSKEAPLDLPSTSSVNINTSPNLPSTLDSTDANSTAPLPGILPACYSSLSACQSTTRNCTGHGSCVLKYRDPDAEDRACYSCACTKPEVRTNPDGTSKTTHFGGPACQKKDISMPFWLLAGFSVTLMFVISWAIGLLYTMGDEELPSVIGAGVSGPRAK